MVQISNPSSTVVTGLDSLAQNFAENSASFLCQLAIGTGSYAIGARFLGLAKFTPTTALITSGALLAALALCPSGANPDAILGEDPGFLGGQCPVDYLVDMRIVFADGHTEFPNNLIRGPLFGLKFLTPPEVVNQGIYLVGTNPSSGQKRYNPIALGPPSSFTSFAITGLVRLDGNPDNCGNLARQGGQLISNTTTGDTIDNSKVEDNRTIVGIAPTIVNLGGINTTLNISYEDYSIHSFGPFKYTVVIGGTRWGFEQQPDGTKKPFPVNPDPELPTDQDDSWKKILDKLQEIKECVCEGDAPVFKSDLLDYLDSEDCMIKKQTVFFPEGEELNPIIARFIQSAVLAKETCDNPVPPQEEERLIFAATTLEDGRELFTGDIEPEVVSLRIQITDFTPSLAVPISLYPAADQYKFGSVNFTIKNSDGGGDYLYVFDRSTYVPLPRRGKTGKLRILFKERISFNVYDTGERL